MSIEDATEHGRLLEIKDSLMNFGSESVKETLSTDREALFYLKDYCVNNNIAGKDISKMDLNQVKFDHQEFQQIIDKRK